VASNPFDCPYKKFSNLRKIWNFAMRIRIENSLYSWEEGTGIIVHAFPQFFEPVHPGHEFHMVGISLAGVTL